MELHQMSIINWTMSLDSELMNAGTICMRNSKQFYRFISDSGKLVYMLAALGIVLDYGKNTQQFFGGKSSKEPKALQHDDDILAIALSPDRKLCATGQIGAAPKLYVWDVETQAVKAQYKLGKNTRGIIALAWSNDGKYVAFVDNSNDHNLYVIDVASSQLKNTQKTGPDAIKDIAWSQKAGDYTLGVVGPKVVKYLN